MRSPLTALSVVVVGLAGFTPNAVAASPPPTDPNATSPAGATYQIPLQSGRSDAAPRKVNTKRASEVGDGGSGSGGGTGSGSGGSGSGSAGSGGSASADSGSSSSGSDDSSQPKAQGGGGSSIHTENGFGSSAQVPGTSSQGNQEASIVPVPAATDRGGGSTTGTIFLLAVVVALALWLGISGRHSLRRR